jgi:hypothetical protein
MAWAATSTITLRRAGPSVSKMGRGLSMRRSGMGRFASGQGRNIGLGSDFQRNFIPVWRTFGRAL